MQTELRCARHRRKALPKAQAEIGRTGRGLAEYLARKRGKARPATGAAAVHAQQKQFGLESRFRSVLLWLTLCS